MKDKPTRGNVRLFPKTMGTALILGEAINKPYGQYFGRYLETPKLNLQDIMKQIIIHIYENIDIDWGEQ